MLNKLSLLLTIVFICSVFADQISQKDHAASDGKKKTGNYDQQKPRGYDKYEHERDEDEDMVDDQFLTAGSVGHSHYSAYNQPEGSYRTRSRWSPSQSVESTPSVYEEFMERGDGSPHGYGNAFSSYSQPALYDSPPMPRHGPTCHSLMDMHYPIFSDTCGAVPQARYSLPNAFGHREKWQIAQLLTALVGASTDPSCTRSLRLLLCPALFPPCGSRQEASAVLPCQSFCRAVKARCAIPTLDYLPCDVLPYSSELCPNTPGYGPMMGPGGFPSLSPSFAMNGGVPPSRPFPSLQSLLASSGLQSSLSGQGFPSGFSPAGFSGGQSSSPLNFFNSGPQGSDSLAPILVDFPPRTYGNDYRQNSKYSPYTRSSSEVRPSSDMRTGGTRSSANPTLVRA